ncbi:telomere-binding protein cav-like [Drosophila tropicalis]|uniref:telomere-binding protein cav-like n=1 Tax=Drosophila tropicalis TaxID=46794 RepID=UPI0035AC1ACB
MSLLLWLETLRLHQEVEKRAILSSDSEIYDQELALYMFERTKVTIEDLKRQYNANEVRELCLRTKLQVNMTHLNCVHDAKKRLEAKGRLANRSNRLIDAMLTKAVNRRMVTPYSDEVVAKYKYINLCEFKKDNNVRLTIWNNTLVRQLENNAREDQDAVHRSLPSLQNKAGQDNWEEAPVIEAFNVDGIGDDIEEDETNQGNTIGIINIAMPSPQVVAQPDWLQDIDEINSESMTLCSDELLFTQSESEGQGADYVSFNTQVQATSTEDDADKLL